ncbi:hypothetical protein SELMODRAFT_444559 [Selaginella moellendorffii]|uniref:Uncharacterized protein n=1 Tax=Selaginella moellendorffii TaxID=88036 RepID=D8SB43_SELML|nr:uncharacterized protein LOC9656297 [Selaginella moellendorffii]EFJ18187.1 hypothetical protein SELMODRAFT_444559 [Selaginella moellendorffii]|eukprot:XP_002980536.1 uncharacterized protein LOC9656297 [Selaginella moellendorffii]
MAADVLGGGILDLGDRGWAAQAPPLSHSQVGKVGSSQEVEKVVDGAIEKIWRVEDRDQTPDSSREEPELDPENQAQIDSTSEQSLLEISLPRNLSSPDKAVRTKALEALGKWLASCSMVEERCLVRIWQSIFYCIWSTSKALEQGELIRNVATIVGSLSPDMAILAFKVLLSTMIVEWSGIEKKKLEKFRLLLQICLSQMFVVLESHGWSEELISKFSEAFGERSLMESQAQGVNLFLAQAFVEELRSRIPPSSEVLRILLEPFVAVFATSTDKTVLQRVRDTVFLQLLQEARKAVKVENGGEEEKKCLGSLVLGLPLAGKFFELSAEPSLGAINKKFLQQLCEDFSRSEGGVSSPAMGMLKPAVTPPPKVVVAEELAEPASLSVNGRKRKRITGEAVVFQSRRVLRSELKLALQSSDSDPEDSPRSSPRRSPRRSRSPSPSLSPRRASPRRRGGSDEQPAQSEKEVESTSVSGDEDLSSGGGKKVRFALKNNLVWSPRRPLPPAWVRVPPCAAPRGSAMKPGVLPGPIADPPPPKQRRTKERKHRGKKKAPGVGSPSPSSSGKKSKKARKRA